MAATLEERFEAISIQEEYDGNQQLSYHKSKVKSCNPTIYDIY